MALTCILGKSYRSAAFQGLEHHKIDVASLELVGELEEMLERAHRPGQAGDHERVAVAHIGERGVELGGQLANSPVTPWSVKMRSHPAALSSSICESSFCPRVLTRAYPIFAMP
jgi:hypothetical protein